MRHRPATLLAVLFAASPALAAGPGGDTEPPRAMYLRYCGACHGPTGRGDGMAGTFLRPKPIDLTTMAREHGGRAQARSMLLLVTEYVRSIQQP